MQPREKFLEVSALNEVSLGKMFGADCLKAGNGKVLAIFWKDSMLFKLGHDQIAKALEIPNAIPATHLYATDRALKGCIPFTASDHWLSLATKALENSYKASDSEQGEEPKKQ